MIDSLRKLDLNLLVVLDVLLEERSVTRAAARLALSQPATSAALARLRLHLDDRLLVRSRGEMLLTSRATALREPIKEALQAISQALEAREVFDPAAIDRGFRITMTDIASLVLGRALVTALHREAPRAALEVVALDRSRLHDWLRNGTVDAAVIVAAADDRKFECEALFEDELVFLVAPDHPLAGKGRIGAAELVRYPRIDVSFAGGLMRPVFERMEARGHVWTATMTVPHFLIMPSLLRGTEFVGIMGRLAAQQYEQVGAAVTLRSEEMLPTIRYWLAWHRRVSYDPVQIWFRKLVQSVVAAPQGDRRKPAGRGAPTVRAAGG
jgi:DNA-binding transcriptional LysR family regulator